MCKKVITILLTIAAFGYGQQLGIYWENDGTFAKPNDKTDRHYTNGVRIDYVWNSELQNLDEAPHLKPGKVESLNFGLFVGQHMQTPDYISTPELRHDPDMRYAGWLYGGPFMQKSDEKSMTHIELSLGVIGPSALGRETQDWIHGFRGLEKAVDWDSQLSDRFAGNINWLHKFKIGKPNTNKLDTIQTDLIGETAFALGTVHRNASAGITFRLGSNLPQDFGPGLISRPKFYSFQERDASLMFFTRIAASVVEHNELLADLEKETLTGECQVGISYSGENFEIGYSQVFMAKQYKYQPDTDSYASFIVRISF